MRTTVALVASRASILETPLLSSHNLVSTTAHTCSVSVSLPKTPPSTQLKLKFLGHTCYNTKSMASPLQVNASSSITGHSF